MPSYVIALDSIGAGDRYLPEPGASIFLPPNVTVHSTDASAVYGVGAGYTASIEGELIGGFAGLRLASTLTGVGHGVNITETGIVGGVLYGLSVVGTGNMVVNNGLIYSQNYGIYVSGAYSAGNTTSVSTVRNEGRIITEGAGVLHGGGRNDRKAGAGEQRPDRFRGIRAGCGCGRRGGTRHQSRHDDRVDPVSWRRRPL